MIPIFRKFLSVLRMVDMMAALRFTQSIVGLSRKMMSAIMMIT